MPLLPDLTAGGPTVAPVRVLLVEDEPLYAEQVEALLYELGYETVGPAATARQALALYHGPLPIDLALLDIGLQGPTNGLELARQLLAHAPVPIIFLTSFRDAETVRQAQALQPAAYLTKPIDVAALRQAVTLAVREFSAHSWPGREPLPTPKAEAVYVLADGLLERVPLGDICYVTADEDLVCRLHLTGRSLTVQQPLVELVCQLPADHFVPIQAHCLINLTHLQRLDSVRRLAQVSQQQLPVAEPYLPGLLGRLPVFG